MLLLLATTLAWLLPCTLASQRLYANALVPCMGTSGVTSKKLSVMFDRDNSTIIYDASVNVAISGYVYADIELYVYGLHALSERINPCSESTKLKQLCPLNAGKIDISGTSTLGDSITKHIPGIAFQVPDVDAYVIAKVRDIRTGELQACLLVEVKNTKTVEQTAVKWVTAVLSGVGLLVSTLLVFFDTASNGQSVSAVTVLMLNYFQSMAFLDMEAVERVPPMASAWTQNVAWSVGLIYTKFMQKIFRWYVQATGGHPVTYMEYPTVPVMVQKLRRRAETAFQQVSPRPLDWLYNLQKGWFTPEGRALTLDPVVSSLSKRDSTAASEAYVRSSDNLVVYRGIKRLSYKSGIEITSAVLTSFTIFVFICVCVVLIYTVLRTILHFMLGGKLSPRFRRQKDTPDLLEEKQPYDSFSARSVETMSRGQYLHSALPFMMKGTILKLWTVAFPSIMVFSMWEWVQQDSAAVIVTSAFMFVICLALMLLNAFRVFVIARKSQRETGTPAYLLYGDPLTLQKYGYLYSMFDAKYYYFGAVYLAYNFVKACFLAFAQSSGKTQALALFIIELAMFITVAVLKPFLSKAVNAIQITTHVIITINACFFLFFSNLMTQPLIVNGVMGVVYFILNAAFSLALLLYIIIYSLICFIWRPQSGTNADHNVTDDRQSFIVDPNTGLRHGNDDAEELEALGKAAQADHVGDASNSQTQLAWFDRSGPDAVQNPFEPPLVPPSPAERDHLSGNYEGRTYTMTSDRSFTPNTTVGLNELTPPLGHNGHKITESQTSFGLSRSSPLNDSDSMIRSQDSGARGGQRATQRLSSWFRRK